MYVLLQINVKNYGGETPIGRGVINVISIYPVLTFTLLFVAHMRAFGN